MGCTSLEPQRTPPHSSSLPEAQGSDGIVLAEPGRTSRQQHQRASICCWNARFQRPRPRLGGALPLLLTSHVLVLSLPVLPS